MRRAQGPAPLVNGVSPNQGFPGDVVTIRGENLGNDARDLLAVFICSKNCLMTAEWHSSKKIVARTADCRGSGDIVIVTRSGGQGTSNVQYCGLQRTNRQIDPLKEYPAWVDETVSLARSQQQTGSPAVLQPQDPLGISDETGPQFSEDELKEMFPGACGDLTQENFSPVWYLLENHSGTGFDSLKAGLRHMKEQAGERADKPVSFAKTNVSTYLACQDTLTNVHQQMCEDRKLTTSGNLTAELGQLLEDANQAAGGLFEEVLRRKELADRTRSTLSVLQRFRFLFQLPGAMDRNITRGDYDLVIADYNKGKQLLSGIEGELFKAVYAEASRRIEKLRVALEAQLLQLPAPLDQQTRILKYLSSLGQKGDPGWKLLTHEHKWILKLMTECRDMWLAKENQQPTSAAGDGSSPQVSGGIPWRAKSKTPKTNPNEAPTPLSLSFPGATVAPGVPPRVAFLQQLCAILSQTLPDMCALAEHCFTSDVHTTKPEKAAPGTKRCDSLTKRDQFKEMESALVTQFCGLVRAAFIPPSDNASEWASNAQRFGHWDPEKMVASTSWLSPSLQRIRSCCGSLQKLPGLPDDCVVMLKSLALDSRAAVLTQLLNAALEEASYLDTSETWAIRLDDKYGGITNLPSVFEGLVIELIQVLNQVVVRPEPGEIDLWSQVELQQEVTQLCVELLKVFVMPLQILAFRSQARSTEITSAVGQTLDTDVTPASDLDLPPLERRLLAMLSNCRYVIQQVLPSVVESFTQHGFPGLDLSQELIEAEYEKLDAELFEAFIEEKCSSVLAGIEQDMYTADFSWSTCLKPTGVRSYVKRALMEIVHIHAEVCALSPPFVSRVLGKVCSSVAKQLVALFTAVKQWSAAGAAQALLDLSSFAEALGSYAHLTGVEQPLKDAIKRVPQVKDPQDQAAIAELKDEFLSKMRLQLTCFELDSSSC